MAGKRKISREEELLWRQVTEGVEPLSSADMPEAPETPDENRAAKKKTKARAPKSNKESPPPVVEKKSKPQPELALGKSAGLDKRNAQRLKRGQLRPEARVDLHGMIQTEAHAALNDFVAESYMAGVRNALVITGKGSVREGGVLRRMVPRWLNQPPLRDMVVAIEQATPRDGGTGAYYLLLRRRR